MSQLSYGQELARKANRDNQWKSLVVTINTSDTEEVDYKCDTRSLDHVLSHLRDKYPNAQSFVFTFTIKRKI